MHGNVIIRTWAALAALALLAGVPAARAQIDEPLRPERAWRTLETRHFVVHYPAEAERWTLPVAARLDSMHAAVSTLVGNAPPRRTTVVVTDPYNVSNGFAIPFLRSPTMVLWPTPPEPRTGIGEHRGWGELLAIHEYGHLAHLAWPSRNARERRLWALLPVQLGPITRRAPRWVIEGYATYIEGRLTGSGRPHGAWRPAVLRQWALEGRLPTYAQLSSWSAYQGGAMAYLAGSAFLEWLAEQRGEESLNHLWRRLTAVQRRNFDEAFAGVYGAPPDELYGRFTVELMREALEADRLLREEGLAEGELYQRLSWHTGDPAVSPDGSRVAIVLRSRDRPARVVVWHTEEPPDTAAERARQRLLERDPLDVPAVQERPRPKRPLATLPAVAGRGHDQPRFLPDGRRLLVSRAEPLPGGELRPDLFVWDTESGALRRLTRGAGIRHADPAPDGRRAVAVRCGAGICDLVRVELASGVVELLHAGAPERVFYRPRYAPAGQRIAVAVQERGRWRIALTDDEGAPLRYVDPDDGHDRYDAAWRPDGRALVVVSHRGGVPNLEHLELGSGAVRPLTRTTGAALAPAPAPDGSVFFLRLHSRGLDLHRLPPGAEPLAHLVDLEPRLQRVAPTPPAVVPDTFPAEPPPPPAAYGLGPRAQRLLPGGAYGADGGGATLTLAGTDPIGRLGWTLGAALGEPGTWRGAGLEAAWRGSRPALHGAGWWARQRPSAQPHAPASPAAPDTDYAGGTLWAASERFTTHARYHARLGGSWGWLGPLAAEGAAERQTRRLGFVELATRARFGGHAYLAPSLRLHSSLGQTAGADWRRAVVEARLAAGRGATAAALEARYGVLVGDSTVFELFALGGSTAPLLDAALLAQRLPQPALPLGTLAGRRIATLRASATLGGLEPYLWMARTDEEPHGWYRVLGAERSLELGPAPLARLPRVALTAGVGYPLDEPLRHRLQAYLSVRYRP